MTAGAVMLASSLVVTSSFVLARRHRVVPWPRVVARWLLPGAFVGLSSRSSRPSTGAPCRWSPDRRNGVAVRRGVLGDPAQPDRAGRPAPRVGAALVVAGGALIAVFR